MVSDPRRGASPCSCLLAARQGGSFQSPADTADLACRRGDETQEGQSGLARQTGESGGAARRRARRPGANGNRPRRRGDHTHHHDSTFLGAARASRRASPPQAPRPVADRAGFEARRSDFDVQPRLGGRARADDGCSPRPTARPPPRCAEKRWRLAILLLPPTGTRASPGTSLRHRSGWLPSAAGLFDCAPRATATAARGHGSTRRRKRRGQPTKLASTARRPSPLQAPRALTGSSGCGASRNYVEWRRPPDGGPHLRFVSSLDGTPINESSCRSQFCSIAALATTGSFRCHGFVSFRRQLA
jgi:hypothetical protein